MIFWTSLRCALALKQLGPEHAAMEIERLTARSFRLLFAHILVGLSLTAPSKVFAGPAKTKDTSPVVRRSLQVARVPIRFETNVGQFSPEAKYAIRGPRYDVFLTSSDAVLRFPVEAEAGRSSAAFKLGFLSTDPNARPEGRKPVASYSNYLVGNDPHKWRTHVPQFAEVWYPSVYPGIDLVYYGNSGQLEYDFVVAPHARGDRIAFSIAGIGDGVHLRKNAHGDLIIPVGEQEMLLQKPRIYQGKSCLHVESNGASHGSCRAIAGGGFVLHKRGGSEVVSFNLPPYDHSQPLVIDPVVAFSTFLGAGGGPAGMALDSDGNIYLVGGTDSTTLPVTSNAFQKSLAGNSDLFIMKLNNDGSQVIYATYLGGSNTDYAAGIALDSAGNVYVTGQTYSTDFPLAHPFQSQNSGASAFVSKLSPDGSSLVYSTYLGGSPAVSSGNGIALDTNDEAIIVGYTYDTNFPTVNAFQPQHAADNGNTDAFVTKFSADGSSLIFSTYLGGNEGDLGGPIGIDPAGNVYLTGITVSTNFPTTPGAYQTTYVSGPFQNSYVSEFSPLGSLVYSTYLPASDVTAIAVNAAGNAFVTGSAGADLPVTPGAFQTVQGGDSSPDAFVTEFNSTGSALVYSTFLGGNNSDNGMAIAVDSSNNAYVTGETSSLNFPLQLPVQTTAYGGVPNAFVSELNSTGSKLFFSTFLGGGAGGSGSQEGTAVAVDGSGNIYVGGGTNEPDFPVVNAMQPTLNGFADGFLAKFLNEPAPSVGLSPVSISFSPVVVNSVSAPQTITVTNVGNAALAVSAVTVSGSFSQTNNCGSGIVANASCTIQATFAPTVFGASTGEISISSNATLLPEVVQLLGTGQDFVFGGTPGSATVSAGQSAAVSLTLGPEGGFAQQVSFSCTGAPPGSSCTVSPSTVTLDGTDTATATMTVRTTAKSAAFLPGGPGASSGAMLALLLGLLACSVRAKTRNAPRFAFVVVIILGSLLIACGGGGGGTSTPGGTYNVVVTASSGGSLSHSLEFSLTVN
jgi:hypothetical protein